MAGPRSPSLPAQMTFNISIVNGVPLDAQDGVCLPKVTPLGESTTNSGLHGTARATQGGYSHGA